MECLELVGINANGSETYYVNGGSMLGNSSFKISDLVSKIILDLGGRVEPVKRVPEIGMGPDITRASMALESLCTSCTATQTTQFTALLL